MFSTLAIHIARKSCLANRGSTAHEPAAGSGTVGR